MTERRYPLEPIERLVLRRLRARSDQPQLVGLKNVAAELGEDRNTLVRARTSGLRRDAAERMAEAAGYIPYEVWPEILDEDIADVERACASDGCDRVFVLSNQPGGGNQKYCSATCRAREAMRTYRTTEKGKEANRRYARKYKAEVRAAQLAREQRRAERSEAA